jgi:hypothetical protein
LAEFCIKVATCGAAVPEEAGDVGEADTTADVVPLAAGDADEDPDCEVEELPPQPVAIVVISAAANKTAEAPARADGRAIRRWEFCA